MSADEYMPPGVLEILASTPQMLQALQHAVMVKIDPNKDGKITFDEYRQLIGRTGENDLVPEISAFA